MKIRFLTAGHRYCFTCFLSIAIVCGLVPLGHAQNYYPDEFGNTWILHSTDGIDERVVTIEGPETIGTEPLKVISDRTYAISDRTDGNPSKFFIKSQPDGVLIFRATARIAQFDVSIDYSPPQTFLPVPIELGSEWTLTGQAILLLGLTIETTNVAKVVAVEPITVPAGTFQDCLKIEQELSTSGLITLSQQSTIWLAPDFGLVKAISTKDIIFELIDYDITIGGKEVAVHPKEKLAMTWGTLKKQ